jgi:hypothetical protein
MHTCIYTYICMYVCMYVTYIAAYDKEAGGGDESRILKIARCMRSGGACKWFVLILLKHPICGIYGSLD